MTTLFGSSHSKRRKRTGTPISSSTSVSSGFKNSAAALSISEPTSSACNIRSIRDGEVVDGGDTHSFEGLGLCRPLLEACNAMGFKKPTPVQSRCIPGILNGRDVFGCAETGSGKTAAFALPMLHRLTEDPYGIFGVVITPTRELAMQIDEQFAALGARVALRHEVVIGGMDMLKQGLYLDRRPHIVIATPGRLHDHLKGPSPPNLGNIRFLVLDEADRLLSESFAKDLKVILSSLPQKRQTLLFSATMTGNLSKLERLALTDPVTHDLTRGAVLPRRLVQEYLFMPIQMKMCFLAETLRQLSSSGLWKVDPGNESSRNNDRGYTNEEAEREEDTGLARSIIIFTGTCRNCQVVAEILLELKLDCVSLHSLMSQKRRIAALGKFRSHQTRILVSTDVCSRGLDIPEVDLVINFDVPRVSIDYVHRVGRTARAGQRGRAITLVSQYDVDLIHNIEKYTKSTIALCSEVSERDVAKFMNAVNKASVVAKMKLLERGFDAEESKKRSRSIKKPRKGG